MNEFDNIGGILPDEETEPVSTKKVTWGIKIPLDKKEQLDKIKEVCGSGEEAADALIRAFRLATARDDHANREAEVESFSFHINAIQDAFLHSLQMADDLRESVEKEKDEIILSREKTIEMWQKKAEGLEELITASNTAAMEAENKRLQAEEKAKEAVEKMETAQTAAKDKEDINIMLTGKLAEAEKKLTGYDSLKESEAKYKEKYAEAIQNIKDVEIEKERAVSAVKQEMSALELKAEKELAAMEREKNKENQQLRDKIDELKDTIAELKEEIAGLKAAK